MRLPDKLLDAIACWLRDRAIQPATGRSRCSSIRLPRMDLSPSVMLAMIGANVATTSANGLDCHGGSRVMSNGEAFHGSILRSGI